MSSMKINGLAPEIPSVRSVGEEQGKGCSFSLSTVDLDEPPVAFYDLLADRKTEPCIFGIRFCRVERLKDPVQLVSRNADAGIADL